MDKDKLKNPKPGDEEESRAGEQPHRSSAFNEQSTKDRKSTRNLEQEAAKLETKGKGLKGLDNKQ